MCEGLLDKSIDSKSCKAVLPEDAPWLSALRTYASRLDSANISASSDSEICGTVVPGDAAGLRLAVRVERCSGVRVARCIASPNPPLREEKLPLRDEKLPLKPSPGIL